ncbi:MAG: hypothetical protein ABFS32_01815 [Bacteroidota bacterium]
MKQSESNLESNSDAYKPISCSLYDRMESDAAFSKTSEIEYKKDDELVSVQSKIKTFKVENGAEYMILDDGTKIRLDHLTLFNNTPITYR